MIDLKVITTREKKKLDKAFNILGISVEDLINTRNLKEELEETKEKLANSDNKIENLENKLNLCEDTITKLIQNVQDLMTGKYNEKIEQMLAEVGAI